MPVTVIGKRWKFDPAGLVAAAPAHRPAPARSGPHLDVRRQRLRPRGGAARPACRTSWPANGASIRGRPGTNWPSIGRLARRTDAIVVNSQGVHEFYVQHGTARRQVAIDLQRRRSGAGQRRTRDGNCWPNWDCRPDAG